MSDVFLSYTRDDRTKAQALIARFHQFKWSVWWDQSLEGGEQWRRSVDSELRRARVVVVLWSAQSILSEYVRHEATIARKLKTLLPVLLEPVTPPGALAEIHALALTAWQGEEQSSELERLRRTIEKRIAQPISQASDLPLDEVNDNFSRMEVVEAAFGYCAARVAFFRERHSGVPETTILRMQQTYDNLTEVLSPISTNEIHAFLAQHEDAFRFYE